MSDIERQKSSGDEQTSANGSQPTLVHEKDKDKHSDQAKVTIELEDIGSLKEIRTKTLTTWPCAGLMFGEYIVIAILSFPSSYSALGMAGGVITTVLIGLITLYTSHVLWQYCMMMRKQGIVIKDILDCSYHLFGRSQFAYEAAMVGFLLNNLFIMGLHALAGSIALNTISDHATCTIVFSTIIVVAMFCLSLFRELKAVAFMGMFAAATMLIALILCWIFAGIEDAPAGYNGGPITITAWAKPGTTFVAGFNAVLNITYTFIGQILVPTYVDEMANPEDFPLALYACTAAEIVLFTLGGAILYYYVGDEYVTSPVYGSLRRVYAKAVAGFTLPTILIVGVLYSAVTSRVMFNRIFGPQSIHRRAHTVKGWIVWVAIVATGWIIAWIIGEAIPFFNSLLSLMSSLFDSWFGFIFWAAAYYHIHRHGLFKGFSRTLESLLNVVVAITGLFILGAGAYTSISSIIDEERAGTNSPFTCADNAPKPA